MILALEKAGKKAEADQERDTAAETFGPDALPVVRLDAKKDTLLHLERVRTEMDTTALRLEIVSAGDSANAAAATAADTPAAHLRRGRQELSAGRVDAAEIEFRAALAADPGSASAHNGLAEVYRRRGKLDDSAKELQASLEIRDSAAVRTTLARIYLEQKKLDLARAELETSTEAGAQVSRCEGITGTFAESKAVRRRTMSAHRLVQRFCGSRVFACFGIGDIFAQCVSPRLFLALPSVTADEHSTNPVVLQLNLDREVEPVLATYIDEGLADAASRHAALVLITMDTPGGLGESMKDMIQHILASPVPVAVYVSPTGARGASAGFFILLSADIAAMAPATHTGAASPVVAIGGFQLQIDETMRKKMLNDTTGLFAELLGEARPQSNACGNRGDGCESVHGERSAGREADRLDRLFSRRSFASTRWPHDHAIRRHKDSSGAEECRRSLPLNFPRGRVFSRALSSRMFSSCF